ncbi:MAG: hypothetical protein H6619_06325 [Deltaproteobacteria bacterium]|nr:hypothetical protein [Deltaproteobacteria bacterium]
MTSLTSAEAQPKYGVQIKREDLATALGFQENSYEFQKLIRQLNSTDERPADWDNQPAQSTPKAKEVIAHIRSKSGIPFPEPVDYSKKFKLTKEELQPHVERMLEKGLKKFSELNQLKPLTSCLHDKTEKEKNPKFIDKPEKKVLLDILFVKHDFYIPEDRAYHLGKQVLIRRYNSEKPSYGSHTARALQVPCLPYRYRVTEKYTYKHYGKDALLNYDQDPDGKGVKNE